MSLGNQEAPRLILASGTSFRDFISRAILPLPLIQEEQLSVNGERMCAKYCLGEAFLGTVWITDRPDIVDCGRKASKQTKPIFYVSDYMTQSQRSYRGLNFHILKDFGNAPFYIPCLFHMADFRMFSLSLFILLHNEP